MTTEISYEIIVDDIPETGIDIAASVPGTKWLVLLLRDALGEAFGDSERAQLVLHCMRVNRDVDLTGTIRYTSKPVCDRCLDPFPREVTLPLHVHLAPLYESRRQQLREEGREEEIVREDEEFSFYEGDRFDVAEIVREQVVLELPMRNVPDEGGSGDCAQCGRRIEDVMEKDSKGADPRWARLREVRDNLPAQKGKKKPSKGR